MENYKILIQYDGSRYKGWQVQKNTDATIQGKIEAVLEKMTGHMVEVHGSGRTDAGVHALGQVANFKLEEHFSKEEVMEYLNRYLPEDIVVLQIDEVSLRFHSRLSAVEKTYCYRIWKGDKPDVFLRKYVEPIAQQMNVEKMKQASKYLVGQHDFRAFCGNRKMKKSTVREIYQIEIEETEKEIRISFCGNGFLQNMVRIMTGTLVDVGLGNIEPTDVKRILDSQDRDQAGNTISPRGLALVEVKY